MVMTWSMQEHQDLRRQVPKHGLQTPFQGGSLQDIAKKVSYMQIHLLLEQATSLALQA